MSQISERAKSRLDNLAAIEPLLGALRTISMSTWQVAQKRIAQMKQYERNYQRILIEILPTLEKSPLRASHAPAQSQPVADAIFLIIGTERGLCGKFNETLADNAIQWIKTQNVAEQQIWVMGTKMAQTLERKGISPAWHQAFPTGDISSYPQAYQMTQGWLKRFEKYEFNRFIILYNQAIRGGRNQFSTLSLLPYNYHPAASDPLADSPRWPPPIIETDPVGIYHQINQHFIASSFYQALLKSAVAENASRFRIMEEAKQNAEEIMTELNQIIHTERKRQITQEMQELAVGAGLMDNK